jgi:putative membrane protein insertion efficiency factor
MDLHGPPVSLQINHAVEGYVPHAAPGNRYENGPFNVMATRWDVWNWPGRAAVYVIVAMIRVYQVTVSPLLGPACRFEPSCSRYMVEALKKYGLIRGLLKGTRRFLRCHPWDPGGYDPP